jgi:hypothetical protein
MTIYPSDKAVPYVYICTHKETNQFYIGYRERNVKLNIPSHLDLPEYKTSSTTVRPDWSDYTWTIVAEFFDPSHAYTFEQQLIYDNWDNPLMLNGHCNIGKNQFRTSGPRGKPSPLKGKPNGKKGIPTGPSPLKGKPQSPDHIKKRSDVNTGKPSPLKGKPNGKKGIPTGPSPKKGNPSGKQQNPAPEVECPHCGLVGRGGNMTRYHFDNCKMKPNYTRSDDLLTGA